MSDQNIIHNHQGRISSWTGIIILVIIAIAVWIVLFIYSKPQMDLEIFEQSVVETPAENQLFACSGQVISKTADQIIIQPDEQKNDLVITGLIDTQTQFIRKNVAKTNSEGEKSGQLFQRDDISLQDIQIGDQAILRSYPDTPINDLKSFRVQTIEIKHVY